MRSTHVDRTSRKVLMYTPRQIPGGDVEFVGVDDVGDDTKALIPPLISLAAM